MCLEWSEEKFRLPVFALVAGWFLLRAVAIARTAPSLGRCAKAGVLESPHCGASPLTYGGARLAAVFAVDSNLQPKHKAWPIGKVQGQYKCKVHGKDPRTVSCGMRFKSRLPKEFPCPPSRRPRSVAQSDISSSGSLARRTQVCHSTLCRHNCRS
jgi:hypothetical protein